MFSGKQTDEASPEGMRAASYGRQPRSASSSKPVLPPSIKRAQVHFAKGNLK